MFGVGTSELILILIVALIIIGPQKLPDLARSLARGLAEFKRSASEVKNSLEAQDLENEEETIIDNLVEGETSGADAIEEGEDSVTEEEEGSMLEEDEEATSTETAEPKDVKPKDPVNG